VARRLKVIHCSIRIAFGDHRQRDGIRSNAVLEEFPCRIVPPGYLFDPAG